MILRSVLQAEMNKDGLRNFQPSPTSWAPVSCLLKWSLEAPRSMKEVSSAVLSWWEGYSLLPAS